ncbi:MAG: ribonuclease D [Myxococcota bacterium]|nr:ribonuclease D [Myxococcota bacterium]
MAKDSYGGHTVTALPVEHITETGDLERVCEEALEDGLYGLDTEFVRDRTYYPRLALVQLATSHRIALIDPKTNVDLTPLFDTLSDPSGCPILHASAQDLELIWILSGALPANLFDTQLAAAFVGLGQQTSYGNLVRNALGVTLDKGEQFTDWMQRPLEPSQIAYAADDVRYLRQLHDHLANELEQCGRLEVVKEEQSLQLDPTRFEVNERTLLKKVKGARGLPPKEQGAARELALWREKTAQDRNIPRKWVLSDDALVALAKQKPRHSHDLRRVRGLHPNEAKRSSSEILEAVAHGLRNPLKPQENIRKLRLTPEGELAVDFLKPLLKTLCRRERIAPATVGTSALLEELAHGHLEGTLDSNPPRLLEGWRGLLVGQPLRQFLDGELSIQLKQGSLEPQFRKVD